jgi:hypothetical protein
MHSLSYLLSISFQSASALNSRLLSRPNLLLDSLGRLHACSMLLWQRSNRQHVQKKSTVLYQSPFPFPSFKLSFWYVLTSGSGTEPALLNQPVCCEAEKVLLTVDLKTVAYLFTTPRSEFGPKKPKKRNKKCVAKRGWWNVVTGGREVLPYLACR